MLVVICNVVKCKEENENENVKKKIKNTHDILGITCPKNESPFHLAFLIIELHHYLWTGRLFLLWFSEAVKKLTIELPSKAQM
ncbi:hypothetical protein DKM28_01855 [Methanosarcina mazei]|uniref:Uncharacterized protein n=1 Tax=Methanosarcina mazei TaxID=2209 RepID=A0A4P8QTZ0_METMZ|nr:hypothetical protein DKM28_01855 [Methanosarcina mazei]